MMRFFAFVLSLHAAALAQYTTTRTFTARLPSDSTFYSVGINERSDSSAFSYVVKLPAQSNKNVQVTFQSYYYNCSADAILFIDGYRTDLYDKPCTQESLVAARELFCGFSQKTLVSQGNVALIQICTTRSSFRTPPTLVVGGSNTPASAINNPYFGMGGVQTQPPPATNPPPPPSTGSCGAPSSANSNIQNGQIFDSSLQQLQGIVGGTQASTNEYPWQVTVLDYNGEGSFCGGALLSRDWVITAAHCLTPNGQASQMQVRVGANRIYAGQRCTVERFIRHNYFDDQNDIALMKINCGSSFQFSDAVKPICLPDANASLKTRAGAQVIVTGWGTLEYQGEQPDYLREAVLAITDNQRCQQLFAGSPRPGWLCAGAARRDTCQGDSGGPLIYFEGGRFVLYGITSFGSRCASGYPGVYTDVPYYRNWIRQYTGL